MEKLRKTHTEARIDGTLDTMSMKEVRNLCGFYEPEGDKWEVYLMFEGEGYTANSQFEAMMIASQEQLLALQIKK